jgi:hypothetical protein
LWGVKSIQNDPFSHNIVQLDVNYINMNVI